MGFCSLLAATALVIAGPPPAGPLRAPRPPAAADAVGVWVLDRGTVHAILVMYANATYLRLQYVPGPNRMRMKEFGYYHPAAAGYLMRPKNILLEWPVLVTNDPHAAKMERPANQKPYPVPTKSTAARLLHVGNTKQLIYGGKTYLPYVKPASSVHPRNKA